MTIGTGLEGILRSNIMPDFTITRKCVSSEEFVPPETVKETEMTFYGKIVDKRLFEKADEIEKQEQWEIKIPGGGIKKRIRVRANFLPNLQYTQTIKTETRGPLIVLPDGTKQESNVDTVDETTCEISEAFYTHFKKSIATSGMRKMRYTFRIPNSNGLCWQVDVPYDNNGNMHTWCKIDLENPPETIPEFPYGIDIVIKNQKKDMTDTEAVLLQRLYDNYFLVKPGDSESDS